MLQEEGDTRHPGTRRDRAPCRPWGRFLGGGCGPGRAGSTHVQRRVGAVPLAIWGRASEGSRAGPPAGGWACGRGKALLSGSWQRLQGLGRAAGLQAPASVLVVGLLWVLGGGRRAALSTSPRPARAVGHRLTTCSFRLQGPGRGHVKLAGLVQMRWKPGTPLSGISLGLCARTARGRHPGEPAAPRQHPRSLQ